MDMKKVLWFVFHVIYWPTLACLTIRYFSYGNVDSFSSLILLCFYVIGGVYFNSGLMQDAIESEQNRTYEKCKQKYGILKTVHIARYDNYIQNNTTGIEEKTKALEKEAKEVINFINDAIANKKINEEQEKALKEFLRLIEKLLNEVGLFEDDWF